MTHSANRLSEVALVQDPTSLPGSPVCFSRLQESLTLLSALPGMLPESKLLSLTSYSLSEGLTSAQLCRDSARGSPAEVPDCCLLSRIGSALEESESTFCTYPLPLLPTLLCDLGQGSSCQPQSLNSQPSLRGCREDLGHLPGFPRLLRAAGSLSLQPGLRLW